MSFEVVIRPGKCLSFNWATKNRIDLNIYVLYSMFLCVTHKEGLCLDSGDINRLMMKKLCVVSGIEGKNYISVIHRCRGM
jgi:hypothetical protein